MSIPYAASSSGSTIFLDHLLSRTPMVPAIYSAFIHYEEEEYLNH